ncbi:MAG: DUF4256 domain-containing protein [Erysipelotrichia bacterium]|jgi:hypothetical protein|nr:DUF4256 domain-containing protein [Erysipelotrichia bacterium]
MNHQSLFQLRFEHHPHRHPNLTWEQVASSLTQEQWHMMSYMEESGGEPDVVEVNQQILVVDMSKESPAGRRNCCYDQLARTTRKKFPPETSALEDASKHGLTLLDEELYLAINQIEFLDLKTSSWLHTPENIRSKGGALTGDTRFGRTFIYHNGADSYYSVRAYRGYFVVKL